MYATIRDDKELAKKRRRDYILTFVTRNEQTASDKALTGHSQIPEEDPPVPEQVSGLAGLPNLSFERDLFRGNAGNSNYSSQNGQEDFRRFQAHASIIRSRSDNKKMPFKSSNR